MSLLVLVAIAALGGGVTAAIAEPKGRSGVAWFIIGFLVPLVGIVIALALEPTAAAAAQEAARTGELKTCPACAELIKQEAIKCRYCGEALAERMGS